MQSLWLFLALALLLPQAAIAQTVIVMTAGQAAAIAGPSPTVGDAVLRPLPLTDGRFYVGIQVLGDPAFADRAVALQALPQADYSSIAVLVPTGDQ